MNQNVRRIYHFSFFWMFLVIIPVLVPYFTSLGLSMEQVLQLQSLFGLTVAAFEIPSGYVCDRWGRKNTLVIGAFLSGSGYTLLSFVDTFAGMAAFEFLVAIGASLVSGADVSLLYDSLEDPKKNRAQSTHAFANIQMAHVSAESIASILGGILFAYAYRYTLWAQAVAGWIPFVIALTLKEPDYKKMSPEHWSNLRTLLHHVFLSDRVLRLIFINLVVWGLSTFCAVWLLQKYWQEHSVPLTAFGFLWAAHNISVGIVGKQVHRLESRFGPRPLLAFLALAPICGYLGMAWATGVAGVALGFLFYFSRGVSQVLMREAFNNRIPSEFRATANSMYSFFFRLGFGILGPFIGYALDRWGMSWTMTALGSAFALLFAFTLVPLMNCLKGMPVDSPAPVK